MGERSIDRVDESLAIRVASLSRGSQRWLKTALQAIFVWDLDLAQELEERRAPPSHPAGERAGERPPARGEEAASLEDVITGKADLREHLDAYPELQEELEGLADVIDLLREAGEARRRRGEQILREEILGEPGGAPEEGEEDQGDEEPPQSRRG